MLESVHYLKKSVAGRPLVRPWWWFDPAISGEAMADVGTHLADLALWLIAPRPTGRLPTDIQLLDADRWPLVLSEEQFRELTALPEYPPELALAARRTGNSTTPATTRRRSPSAAFT